MCTPCVYESVQIAVEICTSLAVRERCFVLALNFAGERGWSYMHLSSFSSINSVSAPDDAEDVYIR